jgi:DNA repair protein RecO (recombination protein O)
MLQKDEGIILRTSRRGETSKDLVFLGRRSGKIRLIAKGALGPKSGFRGLLEPGNHLAVLYYFKEGRTLFYLKEAHVLFTGAAGRDSLDRLVIMLAALELLDGVCFTASPEPRLVDTAMAFLRCPAAADPLFMFLVFELRLLEVLGVLPDFFRCSSCDRGTGGGFFDPRTGECSCPEHASLYASGTAADPDEVTDTSTAADVEPSAAAGPITSAGGSRPDDSIRPVDPSRLAGREGLRISPGLLDLLRACFSSPFDSLNVREVDEKLRKDLGNIIHRTYTYHVQGYRLPGSLKLLMDR